MSYHHPPKKVINNQFNSIITNIPKPILEIHENKINNAIEQKPYKDHHILYEFVKQTSVDTIPDKQPLQEDNVVEYIVDHYIDIKDVYDFNDELNEYNPMNFTLRHYISSK
jgi:hypothetical protein